jgi:uncharacterized protein YuzE
MKLEISAEAQMAYLTLNEEDGIERTVHVTDLVMVDLNRAGEPVGVEFPWPSPASPVEAHTEAWGSSNPNGSGIQAQRQ